MQCAVCRWSATPRRPKGSRLFWTTCVFQLTHTHILFLPEKKRDEKNVVNSHWRRSYGDKPTPPPAVTLPSSFNKTSSASTEAGTGTMRYEKYNLRTGNSELFIEREGMRGVCIPWRVENKNARVLVYCQAS